MESPGGARRLRADTHGSGEEGWALLETMFAAVLLVVVTLAVFSSLDIASKTSASNKGRTIASSLAEQDQERMRAMTIDQLSNFHDSEPKTIAGVDYSVESRAEWVHDSNGSPASCSDTGQSDYIRITSTVTSNVVGRDTKPVVVSGIVAPPVGSLGPNQGTLAVKVTDRNDQPVVNQPVQLSGSKALTDNTNELGCAVFGYIPAGSGTAYTVTLNTAEWVDPDGKQVSTVKPTVTPGNVTVQPMSYDKAGAITVDLQNSAGDPPNPMPASISINNTKWITPGARLVTPPTATALYPYPSSPYSLYAGSCVSALPGTGEPAGSATALPGQTVSGGIVRVPTITVTILNGTSSATDGVTFKATGTNCTEKLSRFTTTSTTVTRDFPYGTYTVCADDGAKRKSATVVNDKWGGKAVTINLASGTTNTTCANP